MIKKILNNLIESEVMVVGDIMLDQFIYGAVDRISPEAPVPIVRVIDENDTLGGCGNVIRNLANLKIKTNLISSVGNDSAGKLIIEKLSDLNTDCYGLLTSSNIETTHKMRIIAEKQQIVRVDRDSKQLNEKEYEHLKKLSLNNLKNNKAIIISDYAKGICKHELLEKIINSANKNNIPVFIDPKGNNWNKYSGATLIKPNIREVESILGEKLKTERDFEFAGKKICSDFNIESCLITRGKDGMIFIGSNELYSISSNAREVFDVSGAGDTVISSFVAAILSGAKTEYAINFANISAGIVVGHLGTAAITLNELKGL